MTPTSTIVGVSHGSFLTLYRVGTEDFWERQNQTFLVHDEWKERRAKKELNMEEGTGHWKLN